MSPICYMSIISVSVGVKSIKANPTMIKWIIRTEPRPTTISTPCPIRAWTPSNVVSIVSSPPSYMQSPPALGIPIAPKIIIKPTISIPSVITTVISTIKAFLISLIVSKVMTIHLKVAFIISRVDNIYVMLIIPLLSFIVFIVNALFGEIFIVCFVYRI